MPKQKVKTETVSETPKPEDVLDLSEPITSEESLSHQSDIQGGYVEKNSSNEPLSGYSSKVVYASILSVIFLSLGYLLLGLSEFIKYILLQLSGYTWTGSLINKLTGDTFGEGREEALLEFPMMGIIAIIFLISSLLLLYHALKLKSGSKVIYKRLVILLIVLPLLTLILLFIGKHLPLSAEIIFKNGSINLIPLSYLLFFILLPMISIITLLIKRDEFNDQYTETPRSLKILTIIYFILLILPVLAVTLFGYSKAFYNPDNYATVSTTVAHKVYEPTYLSYDLFQRYQFKIIEEANKKIVTVEYHQISFNNEVDQPSIYIFQENVGRGATLISDRADDEFLARINIVDVTIAKEGQAYIDTYTNENEMKRLQFITQDGIRIQIEIDDVEISDDELVKMANSMKSR